MALVAKSLSTGKKINDEEHHIKPLGKYKSISAKTGKTPAAGLVKQETPLPERAVGAPQQKDNTLERAQAALARTKAPQLGIGFGTTTPKQPEQKAPNAFLPKYDQNQVLKKAKEIGQRAAGKTKEQTDVTLGQRLGALPKVNNIFAKAGTAIDTLGNLAIKGAQEREAARANIPQIGTKEYLDYQNEQLKKGPMKSGLLDKLVVKVAEEAGIDPTQYSPATLEFLKDEQEARETLLSGLEGPQKTAAELAMALGDVFQNKLIEGTTGIPYKAIMATTSGTEAAQRKLSESKDAATAGMYGAGAGGISALVESLGGIGGGIAGTTAGQKIMKILPEKTATALFKLADNALVRMGVSAGSEAFEEAAEYVAQWAWESIVDGEVKPFDWEELKQNVKIGGLAGGTFEGINLAVNGKTSLNPEDYIANEDYRVNRGENEAAARMAGQLDAMYGANKQQGKAVLGEGRKNITETQQPAPEMPTQEVAPQVQEVAPPVQEIAAQPETDAKAKPQSIQTGDRQSWLTWDWADRLKRIWGLGIETERLRTELDETYRDVDRNGWTEENTERLNKLAKQMVDSEKGTVNQDRTQQIKDARAYLRKITLPVTPDMKAELEHRFGDWKTFTSKFRNRIHFRLVDGKTRLQGIDAHYSQLHELCPEWFPEGIENASDYDIMAHVVNFVENANEVRDYALNQNYDAAVKEIYEQIRGGYDEIHQLLDASGEVDTTTYAPEMEDRIASAAKAPTETANMLRDDTGEGGMLASARGNLEDVAEQIDGGGSYMNLDISRVLDRVAGKNKQLRQRLYEAVEKPLAEAKAKYARSVIGRLRSYKAAMDRLNIKAGSKESAAVQWYGEGQRQTEVDGETRPYTLEMLKRDFPDRWQNIVEAEKIHRLMYNEYVERINQALAMIFPNVEARAAEDLQILKEKAAAALERASEQQALVGRLVQQAEMLKAQMQSDNLVEASKARQELTRLTRKIAEETHRITSRNKAANDAMQAYSDMQAKIKDGSFFVGKRLMPRKDYFHHFVEIEQGIGGLINILNRPSDIATELVGISDNTKPKTKWWGALQRRTGAVYVEDAVGGMARYIPAAEYKINIDPFIAQMRGTIKSLVDGSAATRNANGFIEFLTDWTNDLAGKSNPIDRGVQKVVGRKAMKVLEWVNNRVKANAIVGNIGSAIVQIGNIPNATTYITNMKAWARAAATMMNREKANTLLAQSGFLTERYMGKVTGMFDQKGALQKSAEWLLEIGDQKASELIWLAAYEQYEEAGGNVGGKRRYESAADYADDITRRSVAGRGIGELPLTQRSRVVKLFAPFQVEVNNAFNLMKEQLGEKNAKGLINYCASAWLTNALIEAVANKRPLFDPIQALIDAIKAAVGDEEEEGSGGAAVQRLLGEAAANVPYISTVAPMFFDTDDMEQVFGEQDPTRYGTGLSATADIFKQMGNAVEGKPVDWVGLGTTYVTPYGGQQLERVIKASQDVGVLPRRMIVDEEGNIKRKRAETPANYNDAGKLRFELDGAGDIALDYLFGPYATSAGREYVKNSGKPLNEKKTNTANEAVKKGIPLKTYREYIESVDRDKNGSISQEEARTTLNQMELTREQKEFLFGKTNKAWKNNPYK